MNISILKSKIHRAIITEANLHYIGSLTLDEDMMDAANMIENEKVQIVNVNNGERIETYLIKGRRGSGVCCLNGPAARKGMEGDMVVIISYCTLPLLEAKNPKSSSPNPETNYEEDAKEIGRKGAKAQSQFCKSARKLQRHRYRQSL